MSVLSTTIPGYIVGTWKINPFNSDIAFTVRHLGVSKVHGRFNQVSGEIVTGESVDKSTVSAVIVADSVDTGFPARDTYIKGDDALAVNKYQELRFVSTGVRTAGDGYLIDGDLTIRGVTKPVTLAMELGGFGDDPTEGHKVLGISASTVIKRSDFGISANIPPLVIGEDIDIQLDVQAIYNV